ncbi:hypothetical protein AAG570_008745 [Ranatra chinensis]|uniref:Uncharacterized protein n=1 Tax=Ranatra chinensis TaxID=642074 RepID=A0ABD0ZCY1_9HEMI
MPVKTTELLKAAEIVAEERNLKATIKHSLAASGFTFATTLLGGLLGGPVGIFAGAVVGGGTSMIATKGKFKSVVTIIRDDLTAAQRTQLCNHLISALKDVGIEELVGIAVLVMREEALALAVMKALKTFFESDLHMTIA